MLRRSPIARKAPLRSGGFLRRAVAKVRRRNTGPDRATRLVVWERSGGMCEMAHGCNAMAVDVHHRKPRRSGGTKDPLVNSPANLLAICRAGHNWVESNRMEALLQGLLLLLSHACSRYGTGNPTHCSFLRAYLLGRRARSARPAGRHYRRADARHER